MTIPRGLGAADNVNVTDKTDTAPVLAGSWLRGSGSWKSVLAAGLAVFTAAAVTLVVGLDDAASADTYVSAVTRAVIALPDGSEKPARIGDLLVRGAELRTGQGGGARLSTAGRDVYVGALSTVHVLDGVREALVKGLVMVDTRGGPPLTVATEAGVVSTGRGVLDRIEQNVATLRLAVYDGRASVTAADRRATTEVPGLHQVLVPYGGVPASVTALALTVKDGSYDAWEQLLASNLVQADVDLNSFASGLNGRDGIAVLRAANALFRAAPLPGRTRGEQALAVAVAQKARLNALVQDNLAEVQRDRGDGGSWGVVAAIVQASVTDVTGVLGTSLDVPAVGPGSVVAGPQPVPGLTPGATSTGSGPRPTSSPTATGTATPKRSVSPSPSTVDQVVKTVLDLLPTPTPSAPAIPTHGRSNVAVKTTTSPTPLAKIGSLGLG